MKKLLSLIVAMVMLFSLAGCITITESDEKEPVEVTTAADKKEDFADELTEVLEEVIESTENEKDEQNKGIETENGEASVEETVIYDKNDIVVTVKGLEESLFYGAEFNVLIENNSDVNILVQTRNTSINGFMMDPLFSCEVAAGKKANDSISFMSSDLEIAGISTIQSLELNLYVVDADTWDEIDESDVILIETDAVDYVQKIDDSGKLAYEDDEIRIIVKTLESEESFWGSELYLFIENKSDKNIIVQTRDCSVNGFMIDPLFSCEVAKGKMAYDSLTFMEADLEDNDIIEIETIEVSFYLFDSESWDEITQTEAIAITF